MHATLYELSETERTGVQALQGYGILDSPNEPEFDVIVKEAAAALRMPIALISLLDENRQWFKAKVGLEASETPRSISFCTHAVRGPDVMLVNDATKDDRFSTNPLVTGDPKIRTYAGAPLKTSGGARIGTLCVLDTQPGRILTPAQASKLEELAVRVVEAMERRAAAKAKVAAKDKAP